MANGALAGQLDLRNTKTNNIYCCVYRFLVMIMLYNIFFCQQAHTHKKSLTKRLMAYKMQTVYCIIKEVTERIE